MTGLTLPPEGLVLVDAGTLEPARVVSVEPDPEGGPTRVEIALLDIEPPSGDGTPPADVTLDCTLVQYADGRLVLRDRHNGLLYFEPPREPRGYWADCDDGEPIHYPDAASHEEAAQLAVETGDWNSPESTIWVDVRTWPDGDVDDRERHTIAVDPDEPACSDEHEHDWCSPHAAVGGLRENPGVWGHGGGVVILEVCRHCGVYRRTDTWAQRPDTGEQGLTSVSYRAADAASRAWIASLDDE